MEIRDLRVISKKKETLLEHTRKSNSSHGATSPARSSASSQPTPASAPDNKLQVRHLTTGYGPVTCKQVAIPSCDSRLRAPSRPAPASAPEEVTSPSQQVLSLSAQPPCFYEPVTTGHGPVSSAPSRPAPASASDPRLRAFHLTIGYEPVI